MRKILDTTLVSRRSRVVASQIHRSISSSAKNHGLRFEGILKSICKEIALQKTKNPQIRMLEGDYIKAPVDSREKERPAFNKRFSGPNASGLFRGRTGISNAIRNTPSKSVLAVEASTLCS